MELIRRIKEAYDNGKRESELLRQRSTYTFIGVNTEGIMHDDSLKEYEEIKEQIRNISRPSNLLEKLAYNMGRQLNF